MVDSRVKSLGNIFNTRCICCDDLEPPAHPLAGVVAVFDLLRGSRSERAQLDDAFANRLQRGR